MELNLFIKIYQIRNNNYFSLGSDPIRFEILLKSYLTIFTVCIKDSLLTAELLAQLDNNELSHGGIN